MFVCWSQCARAMTRVTFPDLTQSCLVQQADGWRTMSKRLINIDNGGTLTDVCVVEGDQITFTKTLTTPYDLSRCLFDGLTKASEALYGEPQLAALLQSTDYIRYSTTQGNNALVQRQGPKLGLMASTPDLAARMTERNGTSQLFDVLVGDRVVTVDVDVDDETLSQHLVTDVNELVRRGANRLVVAFGGPGGADQERRVQRMLLSLYPRHLLGSIPLMFSAEMFGADPDDARRAWSSVFNAFLHPSMERFLFSAEARLREYRTRRPLLIFRNDGGSSRVAKSAAIKTYSSGPRGGLEGTKAMARHYDFNHVLMVDVGGTTTDVGVVRDGSVQIDRHGLIAGVQVSLSLAGITSTGVGGSSVVRSVAGVITVGPDSLGSAPGPACFGLGGTDATITDVLLLMGVLGSSTFLGGTMNLDAAQSAAAVRTGFAEPLGVDLDQALVQMEAAFTDQLAKAITAGDDVDAETVVAAFGGAGPMTICDAARKAGVRRVLVPRAAAVFSAYGIGFSDITRHYEMPLYMSQQDPEVVVKGTVDELTERARRDMFGEGVDLDGCDVTYRLVSADGSSIELDSTKIVGPWNPTPASLELSLVSPLPHIALSDRAETAPFAAKPAGSRAVLDTQNLPARRVEVPVYTIETLAPGATAAGPAIVEGSFFTMKVPVDWTFVSTELGDLLLTDLRSF